MSNFLENHEMLKVRKVFVIDEQINPFKAVVLICNYIAIFLVFTIKHTHYNILR